MADGSVSKTHAGSAEEGRVSIEGLPGDWPGWESSVLPHIARSYLARIEQKANVALVLSEMVLAHMRGKSDEENNEGDKYSWLNDRQAWALGDALDFISMSQVCDLEELREKTRAVKP